MVTARLPPSLAAMTDVSADADRFTTLLAMSIAESIFV
jgi:hypothetical protein